MPMWLRCLMLGLCGMCLRCLMLGLCEWYAFPMPLLQAADKPKASPDTRQWTIDDIVHAESASEFRFSPDGKFVVWEKHTSDTDQQNRQTQLFRTSLTDFKTIELTRGEESCHTARWSPDGQWIAFLSDRPPPKTAPKRGARPLRSQRRHRNDTQQTDEPKTQIWLLHAWGGEAFPLTEHPRSVRAFDWAGSDRIVFIAPEDKTYRETKLDDEDKDTSIVVEDDKHAPPVRLWAIDIETKTTKRLTENEDRIQTLSVSPDGRWAATIHERSLRYVYDNRIKPIAFLINLQTGARRRILEEPHWNLQQLLWSPDGKTLYVVHLVSSQPWQTNTGVLQLLAVDPTTRAVRAIDLKWERGLADASAVVPTEDGFYALLANGTRHVVARYRRAKLGYERHVVRGRHASHVYALVYSPAGKRVVYAHSTASTPTQWYAAQVQAEQWADAKAITELNPHFADKPIARSEVIRWKGANNDEVEGILFYPHEYQKGKRYPLVVQIHGGPSAADFDMWNESWAYSANLYAQRGAFVFRPNYHGSSNYGLKFNESIAQGKYLDLETIDIETGVDFLIEQGYVDPHKLGLIGWSNGAILSIALTVRTTRYKVAVAGAGDVDWASDWGNCEFGAAFDNYYLGKTPLEDPQLYFRKSAFYQMDKVRTPTLIFFGTEDRAVPTQQGWMHYRALQQLGKTEVRFVLFSGEQHSPKKLAHQKRKLAEELAWVNRYLFAQVLPSEDFLKADSPLAIALKRRQSAKVGTRYGVQQQGKLIPEVVDYQGIQVGRFEVTRAQYAEFDPNYPVEPGKENYPASGIRFEQAQAYCRWLSKHTGQTYRLPNEDDAAILYDEPSDHENTLDHWAGYAVNPDDARKLLAKVAELPESDFLLQPVGSFGGVGDAMVFDLGGNVAEWVEIDGKGELFGGSADTPKDRRTEENRAAAAYRGFRVVRVAEQPQRQNP